MTAVLSKRALNRALLERQGLLTRTWWSADEAIERLVGIQAQAPLAPYVGLWSRLERFDPKPLSDGLVARRLVRATAMLRTTIHLHTAADAVTIRPLLQPIMERTLRSSPFAKPLAGVDLDAVFVAGRELLDAEALTTADLGRRLGERWPDRDPSALAYAVRYIVPLVQVPPRGVWGATGPSRITTTTGWLRRPLGAATNEDLRALVRRYLAAFGPATVADITTWSWLTGLGTVVDALRDELVTYRDDDGRELFDVADAPVPGPDLPAPVRFLPEYDNVLLSHADRTRIVPAGRTIPLPPGNGATMGTFLVDGFMRGTWRLRQDAGAGHAATLTVTPDVALSAVEREEVGAEAQALGGFITPAGTDVTIRIEAT
jgi:hypothetical protein